MHTWPCTLADPADLKPPQYKSVNSKAIFFMAPKLSTYEAAELACQMGGGHLASYSSGAEQVSGSRGLSLAE